MFVIPGQNREGRRFYFQRYLSPKWSRFRVGTIEDVYGPHTAHWLDVGAVEDATERVRKALVPEDCRDVLPRWCPPTPGEWELFWGLIGVENFVIDASVLPLVNQQGYLVHDLYKLIWEARFLAKENVNLMSAQALVETTLHWMTGADLSEEQVKVLADHKITRRVESTSQRAELLCMIVTLAAQNALVNRMVLTFDGLEEALDSPRWQPLLRGLNHIIEAVERWTRTCGCPVGVLVGFAPTPESMRRLKEHHPKLAGHVEDGLAWTTENDS